MLTRKAEVTITLRNGYLITSLGNMCIGDFSINDDCDTVERDLIEDFMNGYIDQPMLEQKLKELAFDNILESAITQADEAREKETKRIVDISKATFEEQIAAIRGASADIKEMLAKPMAVEGGA